MGSGEKFDPLQYVKDNYDDYEDGWGLNLMNLKEVTGQEMTDENKMEILLKLLCEVENKKKIMENRKKLMQTMKKQAKKMKNGVVKKWTRKTACRRSLVFIYFLSTTNILFIGKKRLVNLQTLSLYRCV